MSALVAELMDRARTVRNLIMAEVEAAAPEELSVRPEQRWSARDVLLHLGTCEEEATRILGYLAKGEEPPQQEMLPPDEWNARQLARYQHLDGPGAVELVRRTRQALEERAAQIAEPPGERSLAHLRMGSDHELGHLYQIREALAVARGDSVAAFRWGLAYARQQVIGMLGLEDRPVAALDWRPPAGGWSVKEVLIHLAVWDREVARIVAALAEDRPRPPHPFGKGELDRWNQEQVRARSWMPLTDVLIDLGAARAELEAQVVRLRPEQLTAERAGGWLRYREHDLRHMGSIWRRLREWAKANRS